MGQAGPGNQDPAGRGRADSRGFHRLDGVGTAVNYSASEVGLSRLTVIVVMVLQDVRAGQSQKIQCRALDC